MLNLHKNKITYFGHSTFGLTTPSGQVALIDPWVTNPLCPPELHHQLGEMYASDPRFARRYNSRAPGLAVYIRDAIAAGA